MLRMKIIPGGGHSWKTGVKGLGFLSNPVVGSSKVATREGEREIKDLAGQNVAVLSMSDTCNYAERKWRSIGTWRPARVICAGEQDTYRVKFESGREVISTAEHLWYTVRSRTKLATLDLVGEKVPVMAAPRPAEDGDYWVGVMRGIIYGDGGTTGDTPTGEPGKAHIRIYADEKRELLSIFEKFGHRVQVHGDGVGYVGRLPRAWKREFPSIEESASFWRGFMAGWLAADGHVDKRGVVTLFNKNESVLTDARAGFLKAGVITSVAIMHRQDNPFKPDERAPLYRLSLRRFCMDPRDLLTLEKRERFEAKPVRFVLESDTVVAVEKTGLAEPVYCCLENVTKSWTVNGVLTGNCHVAPWPERLNTSRAQPGGIADPEA